MHMGLFSRERWDYTVQDAHNNHSGKKKNYDLIDKK